MKREREESRMTSACLLARMSENNGVSIPELGETVEKAGLGRIIKSLVLDMLNWKCPGRKVKKIDI